ncbi:unnamed protein product [Effrenium voratum]|uniref:RNA helicase n=1 Tax=Effrenium voratum TaxID=2562239 RepID=A0AA36HNJ8_9DINO|nr:unnamed protein product [Effrenium voratum]CAJ1372413.1 unnamed protein product [Effrenium voratum]CAJ1435552.1 unnamed protein product [Effrenium voratum]
MVADGKGKRAKSRSRSRSWSQGKCPDWATSEKKEATRGAPRVQAPEDLPVSAYKENIINLLLENRIIVAVGETGSGKTTQIPQYLLDSEKFQALFENKRGLRIAITQPRRVAAVAMARRVSDERGTRLGDIVGYCIRFEDQSSATTRLRYMTDGCLLRECLGDPDLANYDVVILDEAHERSMHTDVLFALMKRAVQNRSGQLRMLVTSATLDTGAFSQYFDCPVLEVPGRSFAVDLHYHPVSKTQRVEAAVNVALNLHVREGPGHILVFLTGMEECEQAVNFANAKLQSMLDSGKEVSDCLIVPLYGMMQSDDQRNVFEEVPEGCRKLVFSTNIAETSLTVAGVGFVVDCGYCKQKFFNPKTGMESLQVTEVSQVQAKQRAGRAGRTQHGKCFRLYSEETFHRSLPKVTVPEILRSNLASVSLQMKAMGIDDVVNFDFMEPPDRVRLVKSLRLLYLIGALDADGSLTDLGRRISQLPLEPQYGRVLLAAADLQCVSEALTLVSMLSSEGIWYRPSRQNAEQWEEAQAMQERFVHPLGDHLTLVRIYTMWEDDGCSPSWCKENFLHFRALRQARDIRGQLCEQLEKVSEASIRQAVQGKRDRERDRGRSRDRSRDRDRHRQRDHDRGSNRTSKSGTDAEQALLQSLCAGFYMQTARACGAAGGWLIVGENVLVKCESSSAMDGSPAEWVLYTDLVGSTVANCMMRTVSAVDHTWLSPLLPKLTEVDMKRIVGLSKPTQAQAQAEAPKDAAQTVQEREDKVGSARERYLARKNKLPAKR